MGTAGFSLTPTAFREAQEGSKVVTDVASVTGSVLYIDTERPLHGVIGAVTRSYIGLAAGRATGYSASK